MGTNYPGGVDNYQTLIDYVDNVLARQVNDLQDAMRAVQLALGTNPKGAAADVAARVGAVEGEFDATTGHKHTGAVGDGPILPAFDASTGHKHTGAAGDAPKIDSSDATYTSGVSGFTPITADAALDALAGARIVEFGSNANGEYVRWENGLQECWGTSTTTLSASSYNALFNVVCPAAFLDGNYFPIGLPTEQLFGGSHAAVCYFSEARTSTGFTLRFIEINSTTWGSAVQAKIQWRAIGRWK